MTVQEINTALADVGIPYAYYQFNEAAAKEPPFLCWYFGDSNDLYADNENYQGVSALTVELYTDYKDFALEQALEAVLKGMGLSWAKSETYIDSEKMHETVYETEVLLNA